MRRFYILGCDSNRDDLQTVTGYDLGDFDDSPLWQGRPLGRKLPKSVKLLVSEKTPSDLLGNPLAWTIVSERLLHLLQPFVTEQDIEVLKPNILLDRSSKRVKGYSILNVLRSIDATHLAFGQPKPTVGNTTIDSKQVPADCHLFRLTDRPMLLCISDVLFSSLLDNGLNGLVAIKTRSKSKKKYK